MRRRGFLIGLGTTAVIASPFSAIAQWVTRDHRWPPRGPWNQALPRELPQLFREFNGIDFGHSHLAQTLLETQDPQRVERARLEILDFIFSSPAVPPDEEQVSPTFVRLVWEVQRAFNWAHTFHRSLYDLFASAYEDKPGAYRRLLANYLDKPEAITPSNLDSGARRTRTFQPLVKSARKSDLRRRRQGVGNAQQDRNPRFLTVKAPPAESGALRFSGQMARRRTHRLSGSVDGRHTKRRNLSSVRARLLPPLDNM